MRQSVEAMVCRFGAAAQAAGSGSTGSTSHPAVAHRPNMGVDDLLTKFDEVVVRQTQNVH
jgi:hypothetical protein